MIAKKLSAVSGRRVLKLKQVKEKTGLSHDSIYRGGKEGWFPKPVKLGPRDTTKASGWLEDEVDEFLARCVRERDAAGTAAR